MAFTKMTYTNMMLVLFCVYVTEVFCNVAGKIEIQIDNVQNLYGVLENSSCCSGERDRTKSVLQQCSGTCNTFLTFCVSGDYNRNCNFGRYVTPVLGKNSFKLLLSHNISTDFSELRQHLPDGLIDFKNLLTFVIQWKTRPWNPMDIFSVRVEARHLISSNKSVLIDSRIFRGSYTPHGKWKLHLYNGRAAQVAFYYRTICEPYYYGHSCQANYCRPRFDEIGHYYCTKYGKRVLHYGWGGEFGQIAICEQGCVNGLCLTPGECSCKLGWHGPSCNQCKTNPKCVHGTCERPRQCICKEGWGGIYCHLDVNICRHKPCKNGWCENKQDLINGGYICHCDAGYTGEDCDEEASPCYSSPCNNGSCNPTGRHNYTCSCATGFTGSNCDINIDDCAVNLCLNGGICIDGINGYLCECVGGWDGPNCTSDKNECISSPCVNAFECQDLFNNYHCSCKPGWSGKRCNKDINNCVGQCENNAMCIDLINNYSCICPSGFTGKRCEININECASSPCYNRAKCVDRVNSYLCVCQTGFHGKNCEHQINKCAEKPCKNGGNCTQLFNDYHCTCSSNWTSKDCTHARNDRKHCKSNICRYNSTCMISEGKERCECPHGYAGTYCEIDMNECKNVHCQNSGVCLDRPNGFECVCLNGFIGKHCEINVDECLSNPCKHGGECHDGINSYTCLCVAGYQGVDCSINRDDCINIDCQNGGTCSDKVNGYNCSCRPEFTGKHCDIGPDYCLPSPCGMTGDCISKENDFLCQCHPGYTGTTCAVDIDECAAQPCQNGGACINEVNNFECKCQPGYYGAFCEYLDACTTQPCLNGGSCINKGSDFVCKCEKNVYGKRCHQMEDSCMVAIFTNDSSPFGQLVPSGVCSEHSTCVPLSHGKFKCNCHPGFEGERCQTDIDDCKNNKCQNGGTCLDVENGYDCVCPSGFEGRYCQTNPDECASSPCHNNGSCVDLLGDFACVCIGNWKGKTCSSNVSHCDPLPCQNGGHCRDIGNDFICGCEEGFEGPTCQKVVSHCQADSCLNGGTCLSTTYAYTCVCRPGFYGDRCEKETEECASNPCENGGTCLDRANWFHCKCAPDSYGARCQFHVNNCKSDPCPVKAECVGLVNGYRCLCPPGKMGDSCQVHTSKRQCKIGESAYNHNATWREECNTCVCNDSKAQCTEVYCGNVNCFDQKKSSNCTCRPVHGMDCITPPCSEYGQCGVEPKHVSNGGCSPETTESGLTVDCSKVNIMFESVKLPKGIILQQLCSEFRYLPLLQKHAQMDVLRLQCSRVSYGSNFNEMVISIYKQKTSVGVAMELAKYFRTLPKSGLNISRLHEAMVKVTVHRQYGVSYEKKHPYLIPLLGGVAAFAFLIFVMIVVWSCRNRWKRRNHEGSTVDDVFFTKTKNNLQEGTRDKTINEDQDRTKNGLQSSTVPDKLFISDPNKKDTELNINHTRDEVDV